MDFHERLTAMENDMSACRPHVFPVRIELTASYDVCGAIIIACVAQHVVQRLMEFDGHRSLPHVRTWHAMQNRMV
jgi:hypothetical protein